MRQGLHLRVAGGNEKRLGSGHLYAQRRPAVMTLWRHSRGDKKHAIFASVSLPRTHTHTHTHPRTQRAGAPSTRKETEIGNKDHPLCLRTVNGSSNVFNLSPESNNGAHSTPPRYCSTVRLKALGFHHPSLSQFLSPFPPNLCVPFMKGLICGIRRQGGLVEKKKKKKKKTKENYVEKKNKWMKRWAARWVHLCVWLRPPLAFEWHLLKAVSFIHTV